MFTRLRQPGGAIGALSLAAALTLLTHSGSRVSCHW